MSRTVLIVGCGYLGRRVGRRLVESGLRVFGTTRSEGEELAPLGIEPVLADVLDPASLEALAECDAALYCVGYDRKAGPPMRAVYVEGLANALDRLAGRTARLVYASSTGVYGQTDGGWVDEDSPTEPLTESGRICLEAERLVLGRMPESLALRFSGLYGPGRLIRRASIEKGEPIAAEPDHWLNLIHIDDAAGCAVEALTRVGPPPGRLYNATDDRPVTRREFYGRAAQLLGASPPRFGPGDPARPGRDATNKRVSNRRLRADWGVELAYPDIEAGLPAALDL